MSDYKGYICPEGESAANNAVKVLLAFPKTGADAKNVSLHPPQSLMPLASHMRDFSLAVFDQRVDPMERFEALLAEGPACVGISTMTGIQIGHSLDLAEMAQGAGVPTVFGGVHPTLLPEQTARDKRVDCVVRGEGEAAMRSLALSLAAGEALPPVFEGTPVDLDLEPPPPLELLEMENYVHAALLSGRSLPFQTSRGCPFKCTFCCNPALGRGNWRTMTPEMAVDRIDTLVEDYNLDSVQFFDENLPSHAKKFERMAQLIGGRYGWFAQSRADALLKLDLAYLEKMGMRAVSCGLESGSAKILKQVRKNESVADYLEVNRRLAQTGIRAYYNYMTGFPGETMDDLRLTIELALTILDENPLANNNTFYLLTPYPGTEIGDGLMKDKMPTRLEDWKHFGRHNFESSDLDPKMGAIYQNVYFSSKFVGRRISAMFPEDPELGEVCKLFTQKWRDFDFDGPQWGELTETGWSVLRRLFGEHAY